MELLHASKPHQNGSLITVLLSSSAKESGNSMISLVIEDFKYDFRLLTSHVVVPYREQEHARINFC